MHYLRYIAVALASALASLYVALWFVGPVTAEAPHTVFRPLLTIDQGDDDLLIWGSWQTQQGFEAPGTNAIEIRCDRAAGRCQEAYATILHHTEGEDLEAQVFDYRVQDWTDARLVAVSDNFMGCLTRRLLVDLPAKQARLEWAPASGGCEGDTGAAVLVGDPLPPVQLD